MLKRRELGNLFHRITKVLNESGAQDLSLLDTLLTFLFFSKIQFPVDSRDWGTFLKIFSTIHWLLKSFVLLRIHLEVFTDMKSLMKKKTDMKWLLSKIHISITWIDFLSALDSSDGFLSIPYFRRIFSRNFSLLNSSSSLLFWRSFW